MLGLVGAHRCALTANNLSQLQNIYCIDSFTGLTQVSYLHYKIPINLDLTNLLEATNGKAIIKILKYLHLLLSSVTVNAEAYNQTLT